MGNGAVLTPGNLQYMSAGSGIQHSEFNASKSEPLHLFQVWLHPEREGLEPGYEDRSFTSGERADRLQLLISKDGREGSMQMAGDADVFAAQLSDGVEVQYELGAKRAAWLQLASGSLRVNGVELQAGDGVAIEDESDLRLCANDEAEFLFFDLA